MRRIGLVLMVLGLATFMVAFFMVATTPRAFGHSFYDPNCCNGDSETGDCQAIPETSVTSTPGGFIVTLRPGDHRLVTVEHTWTVPFGEVKWDFPDGRFHACLWPTEYTLRCFYAPPMGF